MYWLFFNQGSINLSLHVQWHILHNFAVLIHYCFKQKCNRFIDAKCVVILKNKNIILWQIWEVKQKKKKIFMNIFKHTT